MQARGGGGRWAVTVAGALAVMAALGFGRFSYTMLLPATRDGLALSYTAAGLLATANLVGYLVGSLASRPLADRMGPRRAGVSAVGVLALSLLWMGLTQRASDAAGARAIAGVAGGVLYVQALGLVAVWFPARSKGLASGLMHSGNGAGLLLTGLALPVLLASAPTAGWRVGWVALGLATAAIIPWTWLHFRHPGAGAREERGPEPASERASAPVVGAHPSLATYAVLYGLFGLSYIIYVTFFAEALRSRGLPLSHIGVIWAVIGALSLASGPVWGTVSDRLGRMEGIAAVFILQAAGYVAFVIAAHWSLAVSAAVFGLTAWGIPAIMAAAMGDSGRAQDATAAFGLITTVMGIGQAIGPALAGAFADLTGAVNSGLWISIMTALAGGLWAFSEAGLSPERRVSRARRSKA